MNKYLVVATLAIPLLIGFHNCQDKNVNFSQVDQASAADSSASSAASGTPSDSTNSPTTDQTQTTPAAEVIELKNKNLIFYGTRINGQLALIAEISEATNVPLYISLSKSCGTINDSDIAGDGVKGQFVFRIAKGMKQSNPVILSAFTSGTIVWKVNIASEATGQIVTDVLQTCAPWLNSGGGNLCPAPNKQPYCQDRG